MTYPITERTYFATEHQAWSFAKEINKLQHHIVSDYGKSEDHPEEPFFIETMNDPFSTKEELLKRLSK